MIKKYLLRTLIMLMSFISVTNFLSAQIFINEFVASNDTGIADENGEFEDWVELYNAGSTPVDIGGFYLSDDLAEPTLWQIPTTSPSETTIPANGFIILWFDKDTDDGILHIDAKLSGDGEDIVVTAADGATLIDSYSYGVQMTDVSEGRATDGSNSFTFFNVPTPNATNAVSTGTTPPPIFSIPGGLFTEDATIELTTTTPAAIYYTLDGSLPDENSNLYTSPLTFSQATPLRAIAIAADSEPSQTVTETYLIGVSHVYPIVAVSGNPEEFFDEEIGIFGNILEDIEININVEFYEPDGTLGFNQVVEAELTGTSSAGNSQKSLSLKAKGSLGNSTFDHPVFPDEDLEEYRSLVLRNSGNDWSITHFRDASATSLIRDLSDTDDLISPPKINYQAYRQSILYLNGEYWGIYNLRERPDKRYIKNRFDLDDDEIDFIDRVDEVREGDIDNWNSLQTFLANSNLSNSGTFAEAESWIATDEYMDLAIFNIFVDNQDWPGNNNRRFRERVEDGKWHFLAHDYDFTFGLFTSQGWNTGYAGDDALDRLLNPVEFGNPNPEWATRLFQGLAQNENWRHDFINRMADHLNVLFTPERINQRFDTFLASYDPEIEQQMQRWFILFEQEANTDLMRSFANERTEFVRQSFINAFSEVQGTAEINLSTLPAGAGAIEFSTLNVDEEDDAGVWTGTYFSGINIPVKAVAKEGYVFDRWEGISTATDAEIEVNLSQNSTLTAIFVEFTEPISQTIDFAEIPDQLIDSQPFSLVASASSGLPVSFTILSGPAALSGDVVTLTGLPGVVTIRASQGGDDVYAAAADVERSFTVGEPVDPPMDDYCETQGLNSNELWIERVQISEIDHSSGDDGGYGNHLAETAYLAPNQFYFIKLEAGFTDYVGEVYWQIWIDFNQNQIFEPGEESIGQYVANVAAGVDALETNLVFSIPLDVIFGTTRMRIAMGQTAFPPACGEYSSGETEDYSLVLLGDNAQTPGYLTLEATAINNSVDLFWATNKLSETESFVVERSADNITFEELENIENTNVNGLDASTFASIDDNPIQGTNYYRIRKNLSSNTVVYSNTVSVNVNFDSVGLVLYPNPVYQNGILQVSFGDSFAGMTNLTITDVTGRVLQKISLEEIPDLPFEINVQNLPAGTYALQVINENIRAVSQAFIVTE